MRDAIQGQNGAELVDDGHGLPRLRLLFIDNGMGADGYCHIADFGRSHEG